LSLGNIIGANLLNLTLVTGVAATVQPFAPPVDNTVGGIPSSFVIDIPVMLLVMLILVVPTMLRNKASRVQGILLLSIYVAFCACSFIL
ncbi:MAG: sodium:calcium antiporter, partial [Clostridia bacterium]|nr:sodium:calcium antiporter [Clostridia bacterium]